jgi:hypothetical protein
LSPGQWPRDVARPSGDELEALAPSRRERLDDRHGRSEPCPNARSALGRQRPRRRASAAYGPDRRVPVTGIDGGDLQVRRARLGSRRTTVEVGGRPAPAVTIQPRASPSVSTVLNSSQGTSRPTESSMATRTSRTAMESSRPASRRVAALSCERSTMATAATWLQNSSKDMWPTVRTPRFTAHP